MNTYNKIQCETFHTVTEEGEAETELYIFSLN